MKKKVWILLLIVVSIILITASFGFLSNKDKNQFPHSKQLMLKVEGSMNVIKNREFKMAFVFIDEYEFSEMSSSDNIKKIQVYENNSEIKINKWQITQIQKNERYIVRQINIQGEIDKEGEHLLTELSLLYKDNKIEKFNIGNFKITCKREESYLNEAYTMIFNTERISNKDLSNKVPFSALGLFIKNFEARDVKVKKIDLGVQTLGIDKNKFNYQIMEDDINKIYSYLESENSGEEQGKNKGEVTIVDKLEQEITTVPIPAIDESEGENNKGALIVIPISMIKKEKDIKLYVLNIKLYLDVNGKQKVIFRYEPEIILPVITDSDGVERLLEEEGI